MADWLKRMASIGLGGLLLVRGLKRRSLRGVVTALVGGWLLSNGLGGTTKLKQALRTGPASGRRTGAADATTVTQSIIVGKPADECYEAWRDPDQFSQIMGRFAEVTSPTDDRFHWTVHGPRGQERSWETRIVEDEPGGILRWETPEDATIPNEGTLRFRQAPGDRGTEVTLSLTFEPPGGTVGTMALKRFDIVPKTVASIALDRFKSLVETGEIPTLEANPSGRGKGELL